MKNNKFHFKNRELVVFILILLTISSCTKKFEEFNTDSNGVTEAQLKPDYNNIGGFYPMMQYAIVPDHGNYNLQGVLGEYHIAGPFAGFTTEAYPEEGPSGSYNFTGWTGYFLYGMAYNGVMAPFTHLRKVGTASSSPHFWAIALILKVAEMHKITDAHGPIPLSKYGMGGVTVPFDSQKDVYNELFADLDTAVTNLKTFIADFPTGTPFKKFDVAYEGDYKKWLKYANSLRLRLAMHIVKIDPAKAQQQALKAIDPANGGVFTSNTDNAVSKKGQCLIWSAAWQWYTMRAGASIICYMDGYHDPRISQYFAKSTSALFPSQYVGIKTGSIIPNYGDAVEYSSLSGRWGMETYGVMMNVSEVNFLRAEGALRGWDMGGTPQQFYEAGIQSSMDQWGVGGSAIAYINDATSKCKDHVDPLEPLNNSSARSSITIKWDDAATKEEKLEKIITQKWIALFPDGSEGWTNFRRTGYPKLFPITPSQNHSQGTISTDIQVRRMIYPLSEYSNNSAEVAKAVTLLGGPDNGGTRVWWDVDGPNF